MKSYFFYKNWNERGIKYVEHIYDYRTRSFMDFATLKNLYGINNNDYLKYFKIISSIPQNWRIRLQSERINITNINTSLIKQLQSTKQCNKLLYNAFLNKQDNIVNKSRIKWENEFDDKNINWKNVYTHYFKNTISSKLRNFQYKFLMKIVATNDYLYKCKIVS